MTDKDTSNFASSQSLDQQFIELLKGLLAATDELLTITESMECQLEEAHTLPLAA